MAREVNEGCQRVTAHVRTSGAQVEAIVHVQERIVQHLRLRDVEALVRGIDVLGLAQYVQSRRAVVAIRIDRAEHHGAR